MSDNSATTRNEMILASAGSGKTYQLTNRYIGLMAMGVDPERIIALTFTRKAAGEFFDSILLKLAEAATDPDTCIRLAESPYIPERTCEDYRLLLRTFIDRMHLLFLGTLDSFFVSIVHNFPFEFGLSGEFEILDNHLAALEKERVYRQVFRRSGIGTRESRGFLEAFKQATYGKEESRVFRDLNDFIDKQHDIYLAAPDGDLWGKARTVWREGTSWFEDEIDFEGEFERLFALIDIESLKEKQRLRWETFRDEAAPHTPGNPLPGGVKFLLEKLLGILDDLEKGEALLTTDRQKLELGAEVCAIILRIVRRIVGRELVVRLQRTHGVWTVLSKYEAAYGQLVRRRGKLTFNDLQLILAGQELEDTATRSRLLSQAPSAKDRLNIDYRLDARFDHWLLDEFQDTSQLQWHIVENLVDEVMQDTSGERSLFQVGDIKQAIYGWRGSDTRLFYEVQDRYTVSGETRIFSRDLYDSWRSCPAVIEMVNEVFGDETLLRELYPAAAINRWEWGDHISKHEKLSGYAAFLNPAEPAKGAKAQLENRLAVALEVLKEIAPVENGLTCAILLQTNGKIADTVEYIRAHSDLPVLSEAEIPIATDSALNQALLALLRFAAHPGDTFSWWHLRMTPFNELLTSRNLDQQSLSAEVFRELHREGFESFLQLWIDRLTENGTVLDSFTRRRAEELLIAARQFDSGGSRNVNEFLRFAESYTIREPGTKGVINVMTIHKSKGLGFDVVILPDLAGNSLTTVRDDVAVHRNLESREVEWVFDLPPKFIAEADPVLAEHLRDESADSCYEALCKFYVALTRAKRGLYCITDPPPKKSTTTNFVTLLNQSLGKNDPAETTIGDLSGDLIWSSGDPKWHSSSKTQSAKSVKSVVERPLAPAPIRSTRQRPQRRTPSGSEIHEVTADQLFSRSGTHARDFGTAVHAIFEQIEWLGADDDPAALYANWEEAASVPEALREDVCNEVRAALKSSEVRAALARPSADARCWNERPFEVILAKSSEVLAKGEGDWLSGTFDRVVIESNKATILDFKTDRVETPEDITKKTVGYRSQLETYRKVLARMTDLPDEAITCQLLFTKPRQIITVGPE